MNLKESLNTNVSNTDTSKVPEDIDTNNTNNKSLANLENDESESDGSENSQYSNSRPITPRKRRIRARACLSIILLSWTVIVVVAGIIAIIYGRKDNMPSPTQAPTQKPTASPTVTPNSLSPSTSFQDTIAAAINPLYPDSQSPLLDSTSPQSKALTWMTYNNGIRPQELQRYYIAVIYFAMKGNTWNNKENWMIDNVPECAWYGIECDDGDSVVIEINLGSNGVKGTIPREIALLDMISTIKMEKNQIGGPIPSSIGLMSKLSYLSLWSNNLEKEIPDGIGELVSLQYLYLDSNKLNSTVPDSLWSLSELVDLTLNNNYLAGSITKELNDLTKLERLWISNNSFTGYIPNASNALPNIEYYYIDMNKFKGKIPDDFAKYMLNLRKF